jgi:mannose-6-phosphate isomerase class I
VVQAGSPSQCAAGWDNVASVLGRTGARVIVVEAYPGVRAADLEELRARLQPDVFIDPAVALKRHSQIDALVSADLTEDPVFGRLTKLELADFFDGPERVPVPSHGSVLIAGTGASLITRGDLLVYADLPRWEIQQRQRAGEVGNLGASNAGARPSELYKRAYFVDWRVADRHKRSLWPDMDFVLDTAAAASPKLVGAGPFFRALRAAARRPFRVVPFFDPAPWGGQWMRDVCGLPSVEEGGPANYGWCFDCVPEENSLRLGFGATAVEVPAIDLVFAEAAALLGGEVRARFGDEFPIRFDFLDTMGGGNLSLQVHPLTAYIAEHFGLHYTQDESYYLLDAGPSASVFLGLKTGVDRDAFADDLRRAERGGPAFPAEEYVNRFPARKHDHFLIPAGTVHCSGADGMVLEISATPYIFTFKLWDWDRLGLDGRPRPVSVEHGLRNIQWERDTAWVEANLVNRVTPVAAGPGWREERTGLHEAEFIETRRHWFTEAVSHPPLGGVSVLNLVEGEAAVVTSPDRAFDPFEVDYAETFIVPAAAGAFTIEPTGPRLHGTVKAFVR